MKSCFNTSFSLVLRAACSRFLQVMVLWCLFPGVVHQQKSARQTYGVFRFIKWAAHSSACLKRNNGQISLRITAQAARHAGGTSISSHLAPFSRRLQSCLLIESLFTPCCQRSGWFLPPLVMETDGLWKTLALEMEVLTFSFIFILTYALKTIGDVFWLMEVDVFFVDLQFRRKDFNEVVLSYRLSSFGVMHLVLLSKMHLAFWLHPWFLQRWVQRLSCLMHLNTKTKNPTLFQCSESLK